MSTTKLPEVWMRGQIDGIPSLLQPVAHALLQSREEINDLLIDFPGSLLWERPAGVASVGFHLLHLKGVLDRLFTYARGEMLNQQQLDYLSAEALANNSVYIIPLVASFNSQVDIAIEQLKQTDARTLTEARGIGRKQIPTTVIGLLFHAAEHTMRHTGQLLVTVRILKSLENRL